MHIARVPALSSGPLKVLFVTLFRHLTLLKPKPMTPDYPDLASMQSALRQCRRCLDAGHDIRSQPIFSGQAEARVMVIGQAPGESEGPTGRPFNGSAGTRLFDWLARAGWRDEEAFREAAYICSVTRCYPGPNAKGRGDRVPSAAERALCRPWLDMELWFVQPELIIPLGRLAISLFYPAKSKLSEVIGDSSVDAEGRHILPLPHPSGASRWLNKPENVGRLELGLHRLKRLKAELSL
ncbi:MAG: uracil-DNA glycosylase [Chloroflexi bacterium]|nr:uracil-DNA glycosylase [Chloroflexota bacterium]